MTISLEPCAPRLDKGWARATNCALFLLRKPDRCFFYWGGHQIFAITWLEFYQHFQWETVKNYGTVGEAKYILFVDVEPQSNLKGLLPFRQLIKISNIRKNALKAILDILILMCFKSWAQKNKRYQADDVSTLIEIYWLINQFHEHGSTNCGFLQSRMGERGVCLWNIENRENMESIENMENINQTT